MIDIIRHTQTHPRHDVRHVTIRKNEGKSKLDAAIIHYIGDYKQ